MLKKHRYICITDANMQNTFTNQHIIDNLNTIKNKCSLVINFRSSTSTSRHLELNNENSLQNINLVFISSIAL